MIQYALGFILIKKNLRKAKSFLWRLLFSFVFDILAWLVGLLFVLGGGCFVLLSFVNISYHLKIKIKIKTIYGRQRV